jgi:hypothetical protein
MNQRPVPSKLVNFRIPKALLEPFDDICFLSGKTRTQALSELIRDHNLSAGLTIAEKVAQTNQINQALQNSVLCSTTAPLALI